MIPDLTNYQEKKSKGLISLAKVRDAYAMEIKRFSPETGEPVEPEVIGIGMNEIDDGIAELKKQLEELENFKKDLLALEVLK